MSHIRLTSKVLMDLTVLLVRINDLKLNLKRNYVWIEHLCENYLD